MSTTLTTFPFLDCCTLPSRVRLATAYPELAALPQHETVRAWDREPSREIERLMKTPPVGPERRSA